MATRTQAGAPPATTASAPTLNEAEALLNPASLAPTAPTRRGAQQVAVTLLHRRREQHPRGAVLEVPLVVSLAALARSRGCRDDLRARGHEQRRRLLDGAELRDVLHGEEGELQGVGAAHGDGHVLALVDASEARDERRLLGSLRLEVAAVGLAIGALLVDAAGFLRAHAAVLARDDDGPVARGAALVAHGGHGRGRRGRGRGRGFDVHRRRRDVAVVAIGERRTSRDRGCERGRQRGRERAAARGDRRARSRLERHGRGALRRVVRRPRDERASATVRPASISLIDNDDGTARAGRRDRPARRRRDGGTSAVARGRDRHLHSARVCAKRRCRAVSRARGGCGPRPGSTSEFSLQG